MDGMGGIDAKVLGLLACPVCQGELRMSTEALQCASCGRRFPVIDGIPVLIAPAARNADGRTEK